MNSSNKLESKNIQDILALTPMQEGLLFHYLQAPLEDSYFNQLDMEVSGDINCRYFEEAWNFVIETNEMLRTVFRWEKLDSPSQVVLKRHILHWRFEDLSSVGDSIEQKKQWVTVKQQDRCRQFDLQEVPFRVILGKMSQNLYHMLISNHHILYDGWSTGIILKEFFRAYESLAMGSQPLVPLVKTGFKEFTRWLRDQDRLEQKKFWQNYLEGFDSPSYLPIKRIKHSMVSPGERNYRLHLCRRVKDKLEVLVREKCITLAAVFYCAWGVLLQRYCGLEDVVFGITVSGRSAPVRGIGDMVGLFINTVPLRAGSVPGEIWLDFLVRINNQLAAVESYENTPLVDIYNCCQHFLQGGEELFDSLVSMENYPLDSYLRGSGSHLSILSYSMEEMPHYDLTLVISAAEEINFDFIYKNTSFDKETIVRLAHHFSTILKGMVENFGYRPQEIQLLSGKEKQQLLVDFNRTAADYPREKAIYELFAEHTIKTPDHIAIVGPSLSIGTIVRAINQCPLHQITYKKLNENTNQLAGLLIEKGVRSDTIVGIMVERSVEMIIGIMGILKSGGGYLPIDPDYPRERIYYFLKESGTNILVSDHLPPAAKNLFEKRFLDFQKLLVNEKFFGGFRGAVFQKSPPGRRRHNTSAKQTAYIIYTSGSTGKPKGVIVEHGTVVNLLFALHHRFPLRAQDTYLLKTSYLFDVSVTELFGWFLEGGRLAVLVPGGEKDPKAILDIIAREGVSHINFVPSMFHTFIEILDSREIAKLAGLKYIFLAGEALLPGPVNRFRHLNPTIAIENIYGPTEATVYASWFSLAGWKGATSIPIGMPLPNVKLYILDKWGHMQPIGVPGELYIGGEGLARGYLNNPGLTRGKFTFYRTYRPYRSKRLYKTGDLVMWLPDGNIVFFGRMDLQVKVRGFRIELKEIESRLADHKDIKEATVVSRQDSQKETQIHAFIVSERNFSSAELRKYLAGGLPAYMIPAYFKQIEKIPLTSSGKVDRKALMSTAPGFETDAAYVPPATDIEKTISEIWMELLGGEKVGVHDNFFDIGGNSLIIIRLNSRLKKVFKKDIPMAVMFTYPTISAMAAYLSRRDKSKEEPKIGRKTGEKVVNIAIIGMSCRFPGAKNIHKFWDNLKNGIESIAFFTNEELIELGIEVEVMNDRQYVPAKGILEDKEYFDASFFDYTPAEAEIMDPQMRLFHECCWEGLEDAGYDPGTYEGLIGLYAGASSNPLWEIPHLSTNSDYFERWGAIQLSNKDYISTRLGYKLGLKGPCITLQTACSTSLAAVDLACQGLLYQACDMALAGGVSITMHDEPGYHYQEGAIMSRDGHCRPFDARANGTLGGNGAGTAVLKSLEHAIRDRDNIYAVIKSTAVNNDGKNKVGFTAPGVEGQANVIRAALQKAGVEPGNIGYIETHGTGTVLGDTIEIEGLKQAFKSPEGACSYPGKTCALGSVKANIGHLDAAAGIAGFIKTVLALKHGLIPPSLHFETVSPEIDLKNSPFYINTRLCVWKNHEYPRRAGVSSFGIGGTNVHVVLEEAPMEISDQEGTRGLAPLFNEENSNKYQLILLSAKTETALERMTQNLGDYFLGKPGINLADTAYTLQVGRKAFKYRRKLVCSHPDEAIEALSSPEPWKVKTFFSKEESRSVIFMFSGLGAQYVNMGLELYREEPIFHEEMDRCFQILKPILGYDLKDILYSDDSVSKLSPPNSPLERGAPQGRGVWSGIDQIEIAQLVVFIIEYVLARLLMRWGITPKAMIGYSFGEYAAACLSGVFSLGDALKAIVCRGKLLTRIPGGAMLSVPLTHQEVTPLLTNELSVAIDNGLSCIVAGPVEAVAGFEKKIKRKKIMCMPVIHSLAMHSQMVEPILAKFEEELKHIDLNPPGIPYVSNVTGTWLTAAEAVTPRYWSEHLRKTVRFAEGIRELMKHPHPVFIEIGLARDLSSIVKRFIDDNTGQKVLNLLRPSREKVSDVYYLLDKIGNLWLYGVNISWAAFYTGKERYRIPLPTYPFERKRFLVHADSLLLSTGTQVRQKSLKTNRNDSVPERLYTPARAKQETGSKTHIRRHKYPRSELTTPYDAPGNKTQQALADLFEEFFGIENIGIRDNFFELGGDSLKAVNLSSRIHKKLHIEIPVAEFFNKPTIETLAQYILDKAEIDPYSSIESMEKKEYYELSSAQKRIFIIQQMEPGNIAYNTPLIFKLQGNLKTEKLEWVIRSLIHRFESFRTCFEIIEGQPIQRIHEEVEFKIEYYDMKEVKVKVEEGRPLLLEGTRGLAPLPEEPASGNSHPAAALIRSFIRHFDLSRAPLLRAGLICIEMQTHILMLDIHHIIADGTSMNILARDFMAFYKGEELPWLKIQYKDLPGWQNTEKVKDTMRRQEAYWLNRYEEEIAILNLPMDYTRPLVQSSEGNRISFELDNQEFRALKKYVAKEGITLFMFLLAAYDIFLSKIGNQEDIIVGTPIEGRRHSDLEPIIGMFVNTLALRNYPSGNKTFRVFLNELKKKTLRDFENQDYPFEDLVEKVSPPRDTGRNPLFDTMFALQDFDALIIQLPGLKARPLDYETRISKFDLSLTAVETRENLLFIFDYCTKLFKQETIRRFIGYFTKTISTVIDSHDIRISEIEIIGEEEMNRLIYEFNNTTADYPGDETIHWLFEKQVERRPDHVALVGTALDDRPVFSVRPVQPIQLTYNELNEQSNRLAGLLIEIGVQPDTIVGIKMERSVDMIICILGILKSGGVYLPIDPEYPQERIDYMLKDSGAKILLTGKEITSLYSPQRLYLSEGHHPILPASQFPNFPASLPSTLSYVLYTSGSTGKPKGVMVEHRNVIRLVKDSNYIHFSLRDGLLLTGSPAFDITTFEIWGPLCNGITLFLTSKEVVLNTEKLKEVLLNNEISILHLIPQLFNQLAAQDIKLFAGLRCFLVGGDLVQPFYINKLRERYSHLEILHMYGPTENTTFSTFFPVYKEYTTNIPIGKPIGNTSVYIMASHGHLQPIGVVGELYVGGAGVVRGYLNNPELTAEKFDQDFWDYKDYQEDNQKFLRGVMRNAQSAGRKANNTITAVRKVSYTMLFLPVIRRQKLYKTGDLGRWQEDGNIEFLGRIDSLVKIRGFRVELGEIESRLLKHIHIKDAVVIDRIDEKGDKYLTAYIVTRKSIETAGLRNFLSDSLPDYMIPSYFIPLEAIPLTLTGKIDKKALPGSVFELREKYSPPRNEVERKLVEVLEKVLGREKIGIDENFFMIGGDSIRVIQIASRMRREGYKLEIKDIFHNPTITGLSPWITPIKRELEQGVVTGRIPLTPVQREFFDSVKTAPHHFNQAVMLKVNEGVDKKTLEILFKKIQEHHDVLRMSFQIEGKEIMQTGNDVDYPIGIEEHDLRGKVGSKESMESICNEIQAGINLQEGPLMKIGLFHRDDGDRVLIIIHHLAVDAVSWRILFEDLDTLYRQYKHKKKLELPLKTSSFKEWSEKLEEYSNSEAFLLEKSYWRALESQDVEEIEMDIKEVEGNYVRDADIVSSSINEEETGLLLGKVNKAFGTEINDILLTALGLGLKKTFGKRKYAATMEGHGREDLFKNMDISRTVGWFTSVYPVLLDISNADDPGRQIKEIKENLRKIPHKGIGWGILKYLASAGNKKDIQFKQRPFIGFNYLGQFETHVGDLSFEITNEPVGHTQSLAGQRYYEFDITGMVVDKQLRLNITYNRGHWERDTIGRLMENLKSGLCRLIEYCSRRERREFTPCDFTYKGLPLDVVDRLCNRYTIEDIYPLSPMQEGMLFHSLVDEHSASYFEQISYRLHIELDIDVFKRSLDQLLHRHDILRTIFIYKEIDRPVQVVLKEREIDFYYKNISQIEGEEAKAVFIKEFKTRDRRKTFDLSQEISMRVSLLELGNKEYEVIWSSHHILMDGWCIGILNKEFFQIYTGIKENRRIELPAVRPYRDYIEWLEQRDRGAAQKYWERYLADYEESSGIPRSLSGKNKDKEGYRDEAVEFVLGTREMEGMKKIGQKRRVTLNIIMQGVWGILLGRYTGKEDVVFGVVVSGRPPEIEGIEAMVGLFINTVPVRVIYKGDIKFGELLEKLQESALESEQHHYYPLAEIQAGSLLKQDLIDHIYIFENYPIVEQIEGYEPPGTGGGHTGEASGPRPSHVEAFEQTNYNFNVVLGDSDRLMIRLTYNGNIFAREFVNSIGGHLRHILSQVIESDEKKINQLDIITDEEKEQVLYRFNHTQKDFPHVKTIHGLFEEQAERTPDRIALVAQSAGRKAQSIERNNERHAPCAMRCAISYRQLNEKSNHLACTLLEKGVQPDTIAGLMIERSADMIISILGILKSGGAYLPIDPGYPQERIDYMLKDSKPVVVLTPPTIEESINRSYKSHISYTSPGNLLTSQSPSFPLLPPTGSRQPATSLAYVIYTSGTTGKPKGVLVEHRSAVNVVTWNVDMHKMGSSTFILLVSDFTFDASVVQIFGALISGAILYIVEKEIRLDMEKLRDYIIHHTINLIDLVPTHLKELLCYNDKLESLHTIVSGGEKLDDAIKEIIIEKGYRLVNQYGPTETTVDALALDCSLEQVSMGKPISNVKVYILDRYKKVLPLGVVGELYIAGAGVSRGYLNRMELTAEKFDYYLGDYLDYQDAYHRSYKSYPSYILYRTGDLARWLPDRNIEFMGRIDHQVKIRGFRIELGEIENQLLTHKTVKETIVLAREDKNDKYLCAYIVAKPGETNPIDSSELREYLSHQLPVYMVPAYFVQLDNIPLASHGKVNRKALPEPEMKVEENYIAPRNETEKKLTKIWSDILEVEKEKIGIDDNFFHLGGHSLKATILVSRLQKELKVSVPLSQIFKTSHIRGLAAFVKTAVKDKYKKIEAVETKEYYPVFSAQKRVYLSHQIDKSKVGYNMIDAVPLGKKIEIEKLKSSLKKLVDRHESLRTSFEMVKGQIVQRVHGDLSFEIEHIRLNKSMDKPGASPPQVEELTVDFLRPFDLSAPPLFRIGLVETVKGEHILIMGIHHIITDGRSLEILTEEFISLYTGKELFPLRLQFKDFSNWHNSPRQKILIKEQEAFWTSQFRDKITILNLPTDFERPTVLTSEGDIIDFDLDSQKTGELGRIQIETDTTMFMILIAIYSVFLAKITNQEDILVGIPIAGRRHPDLQQITGMFVNTLVMRSQPTKDKSFWEFLSQMKEYALSAFENQEFQFENLVELTTVKRDASRNPIFDTMFSYQDIDKNKTGDIELVTGQYNHKYKTSLFDLSLVVVDQKDTLKCTFFYNLNLFKKETILRLVRYFQAIIDSIVNQLGIKIGDIDILPEEEKQPIPGKINKTGGKYHLEETPGKEERRVEPVTEKELKILAIWEKILGEKPQGVTADFFQVGGSSIGALLLVNEINKTFKRKLSITDIYENENIRKQVALVEQTKEPDKGKKFPKDKNIFRLKVGSRGSKNIFLIHDAAGEVDKYRLFCKELKPGDNYWGLPLKSDAACGLAPQELEIQELASQYLSAIKQVQARGPYYLGGWSIGGLIAFEMARRFEQAGEQVEQLYMFDTAVPVKKTPAQSFDLASELELINRYFQVPVTVSDRFKATNPEELWQEFLNFIENDKTYNQGYIVDKLAEYSELINDFHKLPAAELFKYVNRFRSSASAGSKYFPETKIKAKLKYYQAELSGQDAANWQRFFIDKIDIHQTRGNHFNMFNGPNLRYLIGIFQEHDHIG